MRLPALCLVASSTVGGQQCDDAMSKLFIDNYQFTIDMRRCGAQSAGQKDLTANCLKTVYPSLSPGCATCFGECVQCGASNCLAQCTKDPASSDCLNCVEAAQCNANLNQCTGFEGPPKPTPKGSSIPNVNADAVTTSAPATTNPSGSLSVSVVGAIGSLILLSL